MFARLQKTFQSGLNSAVAATRDGVNRALPGNPALRDYDVSEQVGTGGTNGAWDIYNAIKKSNKAKDQALKELTNIAECVGSPMGTHVS